MTHVQPVCRRIDGQVVPSAFAAHGDLAREVVRPFLSAKAAHRSQPNERQHHRGLARPSPLGENDQSVQSDECVPHRALLFQISFQISYEGWGEYHGMKLPDRRPAVIPHPPDGRTTHDVRRGLTGWGDCRSGGRCDRLFGEEQIFEKERGEIGAAVLGLVVATPTFVAYTYLSSRVNTMMHEMERAGIEIVHMLKDTEALTGIISFQQSSEAVTNPREAKRDR